ncbi:MAG: phosphohydrolase [Lachnospiraceae bacterium]|nr:phosphohydrolase [Lachnospiraceae bacterium]
MKFVKSEDLKVGMRLAKPIYNKNGVLLYDRGTVLTSPGIKSVRNFGLIGIYILEPAEPLPPLSDEDIKFEQLQTIFMFRLRDNLDLIWARKKMDGLPMFVEEILRHYGSLNHRVNFNQNLRSSEDFMYKHAISTAILVAMITSSMAYSHNKQLSMVTAALFFDIGYRYVPKVIIEQGNQLSAGDREVIQQSLERGLNFLSMYQNDFDFMPQAVNLCTAYVYSTNPQKALSVDSDMATMMMILKIADTFDRMTAMNLGHEPESEISAMRYLYSNGREFHPDIVNKLSECIHIVPQAASVDLSTGDKGIVLVENPGNFMHPVILRLSDNQIYDLSNPIASSEIQVVDIMKTMDNRIMVDEETRKQFVPDERLIELTEEFRKRLYS